MATKLELVNVALLDLGANTVVSLEEENCGDSGTHVLPRRIRGQGYDP